MIQVDLETCPICWRTYQTEAVVPVCFPCGHSCCRDCSMEVRACSICRQRFSSSFQRRTNYSLLSMIDKLEKNTRDHAAQRTMTQETQTQTDIHVARQPVVRRQRQQSTTVNHQTFSFQIKKTAEGQVSGIHLRFK